MWNIYVAHSETTKIMKCISQDLVIPPWKYSTQEVRHDPMSSRLLGSNCKMLSKRNMRTHQNFHNSVLFLTIFKILILIFADSYNSNNLFNKVFFCNEKEITEIHNCLKTEDQEVWWKIVINVSLGNYTHELIFSIVLYFIFFCIPMLVPSSSHLPFPPLSLHPTPI